jgi:hypothetical protein
MFFLPFWFRNRRTHLEYQNAAAQSANCINLELPRRALRAQVAEWNETVFTDS